MQAEAECPPSDEIRRKRVFSAIAFHTEKVRFVRGGCSAALCFGTARGVHRFENLVQLRLQGRHVAHAVQTILQGFQRVHDGFVRRQGDGVDAANHAVDALADNLAEAVVNACLVLVVEGQRDGGFVARNDDVRLLDFGEPFEFLLQLLDDAPRLVHAGHAGGL